jgi:hypothetical protein
MDQAVREAIREDFAAALTAYGTIQDQETGRTIQYDPTRIAPEYTLPMLQWLSDPQRTVEGHKKWSVSCSSRQIGKSVTLALALYVATGFNPGTRGGIITDKQERSDELFKAINDCHNGWPGPIRPRTAKSSEKYQLSFVDDNGRPSGSLQTYSARSDNLGIGRSWDYTMMSEVPFWPNAGGVWYALRPALTNRKEAIVGFESTPAPMAEPSAEWFRDLCLEAQSGHSRFDFTFCPFYKSKLNERLWDKSWTITGEELTWLRRFGPRGDQPPSAPGASYLTLENLAFRRRTLEEDPDIRRDPQLFWVFYPRDMVSCWQHRGTGAIPQHALDRIANQLRTPWSPDSEGLQIFSSPHGGAQYVIGVDPAGFGSGDCSSFVVLEVWSDRWEQVAEYSNRDSDPQTVARVICETATYFNHADVVVESNGVGAGVLSVLDLAQQNYVNLPDKNGDMREYGLKHLWYAAHNKPGVASTKARNAENMGILVDALAAERLVVRSDLLFEQMCSYRRDKETQPTETFKILHPGERAAGRRDKHHWDRVSALMWACHAAVQKPMRFDPRGRVESDEDDKHDEHEDKRYLQTAKQWQQSRKRRAREERKALRGKLRRGPSVYAD